MRILFPVLFIFIFKLIWLDYTCVSVLCNVKLKVKLYSKHIGKSPEQIEADMKRTKYFSPSEAVEYGIIDKVR